MKRALKFLLGLILLPLAFCILLSVAEVLWYIIKSYKITLYFMLGALLYVLTHLFFYNFYCIFYFHILPHFFVCFYKFNA